MLGGFLCYIQLLLFCQPLDLLIKIRINPLGAIEHIIFREGFLLCLCLTNMPFVGENIISAESKKLVDAGGKLLHGESVFSLNQVFDVIKVAGNSSLKLTNLLFIQIVFCDCYIRF